MRSVTFRRQVAVGWCLAALTLAAASLTGSALAGSLSIARASVAVNNWTADELLAREVLVYTNEIRVDNGLLPLKIQAELEAAAQWFAEDMAAGNFLSHIDSLGRDPGQRIPAFGYTGGSYGENVARGYETPQEVVDAWMGSAGHRANILQSAFRELGVGYTETNANPHRWYWVQNFGTRAGIYPVIIALDAFTTTQSTVTVHVHGEGWAEDMRLSNDGINWTPWQTYDSEVTWDLAPGAGTRTVIAEIRRGTLVKSHSDTIEVIGAGGSPTASPSPTNTAVPASSTPTATATSTASATPTASATASATAVPPTATQTPSATPSPTASSTIAATETATPLTATATLTASPTPSLTVTATLGITATATVTSTATATDSTPGTPASMATDTSTPSAEPSTATSPAPSDTPSATSTSIPASPTPSPTATEPPTQTAEPTATHVGAGRIFLPLAFTFRR